MSKETVMTLARTILSAVGAFLIGKHIFGTVADETVVGAIVGGIMTTASVVWGIVDKSSGIEQIQSGIRQVVTLVGGILISSGKLSAEKLETYLGLAIALATFIYSLLSRKKTADIAAGILKIVPKNGKSEVKKAA